MSERKRYAHEAERLHSLAQTTSFSDVRDELLRLASQYRLLAEHQEQAAVGQTQGD